MQCNGMGYTCAYEDECSVSRMGYARAYDECSVTEWVTPGLMMNAV